MSKTIKELRDERKAKIQGMKDLRAAAAKENRMMDSKETEQFDILDKDQERIRQEIEREERMGDLDREAATPAKDPLPEGKEKRDGAGETKGFGSFGEFLQVVRRSSAPGCTVDPRLAVRGASGAGEQVPSDGGYLVQKDLFPEILKRVYDNTQVAAQCRKVTVSGNGLVVNAVDETSRATGSRFGGIQGYWVGEGDVFTASRPKFRRMELPLQKLIGLCYATDELLQDATALESIITEGFVEEFAWLLQDAIINGDGVGKPLGVLQSPCLVTQAKDASDSGVDLTLKDIIAMDSRLWAPSDARASWFHNQDIKPKLQNMSISVGNNAFPAYMTASGLGATERAPKTLFGKPAIPIEQCKTLGTVGDIILGDFSQYLLIDKGGLKSDVSMHVRFLYDEQTYRFVLRVNGQPLWNSALTPANGSATLSPFVALAVRS